MYKRLQTPAGIPTGLTLQPKHIKLWLSLALVAGLLALVVSHVREQPLPDLPPSRMGPGGVSRDLAQNPPRVSQITVQKLAVPVVNEGNMVMRIQYEDFGGLPEVLPIYSGGSRTPVYFNDLGRDGDIKPGDGIFAAYITEDIPAFKNKVARAISVLNTKGYAITFEGHTGRIERDLPGFDFAGFDLNKEVVLSVLLATAVVDCETIQKDKSLFVTDTFVVNDPQRTYNIVSGRGTPMGTYTFGRIMKNIAAGGGVSAQGFLKEWLKSWMTDYNVNGETVEKRPEALTYLIGPWINYARQKSGLGTVTIDAGNWENKWGELSEDTLLKYAPFRLMTIVNRQDLRSSFAYNPANNNTGETRMIFTLIAPVGQNSATTNQQFSYAAGTPPKFQDQITGVTPLGGFADWEGMNVIFEFGNLPGNLCAIQATARQWYNLSLPPAVGSSTLYNNALAAIVEPLIAQSANAAKTNKSAINRIRTNEKIFDKLTASISNPGWESADWEFRQFELSPSTHYLVLAPLTNTPKDNFNSANNILINNTYSSFQLDGDFSKADYLMDWAHSPGTRTAITAGNHNVPLTYGGKTLLAMAARNRGEYAHYFDFTWTSDYLQNYPATGTYTSNPTGSYSESNPYQYNTSDHGYEKKMRQQFSANTCQGCHGGETKTLFTMVHPLGYGETANYMGRDVIQSRNVEYRFTSNIIPGNYPNPGNTRDAASADAEDPDNPGPFGQTYVYDKVSPFLTGRSYRGLASYKQRLPGGGPAQEHGFIPAPSDDDPSDDATDGGTTGLYMVKDPSYGAYGLTDNMPQKTYGYNDLERRKRDMCNLLGVKCAEDQTASPLNGQILDIATQVTFAPFAFGSH